MSLYDRFSFCSIEVQTTKLEPTNLIEMRLSSDGGRGDGCSVVDVGNLRIDNIGEISWVKRILASYYFERVLREDAKRAHEITNRAFF